MLNLSNCQEISVHFSNFVYSVEDLEAPTVFYDNYLKLCNSVRKKPSAVAVEVGFSKSIVSRWKNGGGVTDATVQKVADYFGVTVEQLTGEDKKKAPAPMGGDGLDDMTRRAIEIINKADEDTRRKMLSMLEIWEKK